MKRNRLIISALILILTAAIGLSTAQAEEQVRRIQQTGDVPQRLTYQGHLYDAAGEPVVDGTYPMDFSLWDAASGGSRLWGPESHSVAVADGFFSVLLGEELALQPALFGAGTYVQIAVAGEILAPRQPLAAVAFAFRAAAAPWQGLTGLPAGFADGVDDVDDAVSWAELGGLVGGGAEQVAAGDHDHDARYYTHSQLQAGGAADVHWDNLTHLPAGFADGVDDAGASYSHQVVVAPSGGDYASVQAALDGITDAGPQDRYRVWIAPGTYTGTVQMKPYVDLVGAGEGVTTLTHPGRAAPDGGTVVGASQAELSFLTVESAGGGSAIALYNDGANPRLTHVTLVAAGGVDGSYGLYNVNASPALRAVAVSVSGAGVNYGVYNSASSAPWMRDVGLTVTGDAALANVGVRNASSSPAMTEVEIAISGGESNYGVYNTAAAPVMARMAIAARDAGLGGSYGVYNVNSSAPAMRDLRLEIISGSRGADNYGVYNVSSSPAMADLSLSVTGRATGNVGVGNDAASPTMTNLVIVVAGADGSYGVSNVNGSAPTLTDVTVSATAPLGGYSYGVHNASGSWLTLTGVTVAVTASTGGGSYGLYNYEASATVRRSSLAAEGSGICHGVSNVGLNGTHTVQVQNAQVAGCSHSLYSDGPFTTQVGGSWLGGPVGGPGPVTCAGVYDAAYTFYAATCP